MTLAAKPKVLICKDVHHLSREAVELIVRVADDGIRDRGRFTFVLSGGSAPQRTYALLSSAPIDWTKTYLFFGDERFVPANDERSNYHTARRALIDKIPIPADHVYAIPTDLGSPGFCAAVYAKTLARFFARPLDTTPARFDLVLLGLGEDGHTASLFPGAAALEVTDSWVTWSPPGALPPPVERITLTYPAINAARHVLFLVAGANKAGPLHDVLEGNALPARCPAAAVRPVMGAVTWMVDEAAASLLKPTDTTARF